MAHGVPTIGRGELVGVGSQSEGLVLVEEVYLGVGVGVGAGVPNSAQTTFKLTPTPTPTPTPNPHTHTLHTTHYTLHTTHYTPPPQVVLNTHPHTHTHPPTHPHTTTHLFLHAHAHLWVCQQVGGQSRRAALLSAGDDETWEAAPVPSRFRGHLPLNGLSWSCG